MRPFAHPSLALAAGMLLACASACKKVPVADPHTVLPVGTPAVDLSANPHLLFQVFGDRADPRLMPIGAVIDGTIRPLGLTRQGWRDLDTHYFAPGTHYPLYLDDVEAGAVTVARGMWPPDSEPLYALPGCQVLKPLAAAHVSLLRPTNEPTTEYIASSVPLVSHAPFTGTLPTATEIAKLGRALGHEVGAKVDMDAAELDSLDFHARMLITGASANPTLLVSFIDPGGGDLGPGKGHTSNLFILAEKSATGYQTTYRHAASGDAKHVEFQRLLDHADINGDGIDELFLEAWHFGAKNELIVLSFRAGQWHEVLRVPQDWCLDPPKGNARQ